MSEDQHHEAEHGEPVPEYLKPEQGEHSEAAHAEGTDVHTSEHPANPPTVAAAAPQPTLKGDPPPTLGRIVIVREPNHRDAPGIVAEVNADGLVSCNVFRATHVPHVSERLAEIAHDAPAEARGWFWPPRV